MTWTKTFELDLTPTDVTAPALDTFVAGDFSLEIEPVLSLDTDQFVFEPLITATSTSVPGTASASVSGFATGSGVSSISVSASAFVADDGESGATLSVSATGDTVEGSGAVSAGTDFDTLSFGTDVEPETLSPEIDLTELALDFEPLIISVPDADMWF